MPKTREQSAVYMRNRYQRRKKEALIKLGGACCRCGCTEDLEVDHTNRKEKTMPFSRMYAVNQARFDEELDKCQLLCKQCHVQKTIEERGHRKRTEHGTYASYRYSGCRCDECKRACRDHSREYRKRMKEKGFVRKNDKWVSSTMDTAADS